MTEPRADGPWRRTYVLPAIEKCGRHAGRLNSNSRRRLSRAGDTHTRPLSHTIPLIFSPAKHKLKGRLDGFFAVYLQRDWSQHLAAQGRAFSASSSS